MKDSVLGSGSGYREGAESPRTRHRKLTHSPQPSPPGLHRNPGSRTQVATDTLSDSVFSTQKGQGPQPEKDPAPPKDRGHRYREAAEPQGSYQGPPSPLQEERQLLLENLIGGPHVLGTVLHQVLAQATGRRWVGSHPTAIARSQGQVWQLYSLGSARVCHAHLPRPPSSTVPGSSHGRPSCYP